MTDIIIHYSPLEWWQMGGPVCGTIIFDEITDDTQTVTCPACLKLLEAIEAE